MMHRRGAGMGGRRLAVGLPGKSIHWQKQIAFTTGISCPAIRILERPNKWKNLSAAVG
jgi:hypothetical protein